MATTKTDLFNMALTLLGAETIVSPTQNTKGAKACVQVYDMLRRAELRKKPNWNFAIKTTNLPASVIEPLFGMSYSYPLPVDFLGLVPPYPFQNYGDRDFQIQSNQIYSRFGAPIELRYVADVEDVESMDPLFQMALAARIAFVISDVLVQSNTKKQLAKQTYDEAVADARKANSFDRPPQGFPISSYLSVRY